MSKNNNLKFEIALTVNRNLRFITQNKGKLDDIFRRMEQKGYTGGDVQKVLANPFMLQELDDVEISIFLEQFYAKTGIFELNPLNWYQRNIIQQGRDFLKKKQKEKVYSFDNVKKLNEKSYLCIIDMKKLLNMMDNGLFRYDNELSVYISENNINVDSSSSVLNDKKLERLMYQLKNDEEVFTKTIEISIEGFEHISYNKEQEMFKVSEKAFIDALTGFNYLMAFKLLMSQDVYKEDVSIILIINTLNKDEEKSYLKQLGR